MGLISIAEAAGLLRERGRLLPAERVALDDAAGRVLREALVADRELPPCDRVTLDGYALRHAEWLAGAREFRVSGMQAAGQPAGAWAGAGTAREVATGAVLPAGADVILPYEDAVREGELVRVRDGAVLPPRQGIHARGSDRVAGTRLVAAGGVVTAREIAVAAMVGAATLLVSRQPRVAILATGDELVEVAQPVAPHQVRRSNERALRAAARTAGAGEITVRLARDDPAEIEAALASLLDGHDLVLVTGGVSKGRFDHLPAALAAVGVERIFHGVAQRPGKPLWAGAMRGDGPLVLALPGSPVSAYTCFCRYGRAVLRQMQGAPETPPEWLELATEVRPLANLTWLAPVRLGDERSARVRGEVAPTNTSGDLAGLLGTAGWVEIPPGATVCPAGAELAWQRWEG